jgi:uncharacterized phage protein (TIGR02220 family)
MSFQAMTWAVEQELPALQKLVLLMLANCSNHHTGQCNPSHERLAKECGMSRTSVKDAIRALSEKGIIEIVHNVQDGVFLPNQYKLLMSTPPGRNTTEGGSPDDRRVGRHTAIKQEVKPGKETDMSPASDSEDAIAVIEYLNSETGHSYKPVESNLKLVRARLAEGSTIDECKAVIDSKVSEWASDAKMAQYLRPDTLFNATKFAQYSGQLGSTTEPVFREKYL